MDGTIFSYLGTNVSLAMYLLSFNYWGLFQPDLAKVGHYGMWTAVWLKG
jgi:hypothetical protein